MKRALFLVLLVFLLTACEKSASNPLPTVTPGTGTPEPALTALPVIPQTTPTSAASPTPFVEFDVKPSVEGLKLRLNPGYLFDALLLLPQDAVLTVQGKAPGGEWIFVKTAEGNEGWVFAELIQSSVDLQAVPVIEPKEVALIKGKVTDLLGTSIQGVGFVITPEGADASQSNVAISDASGTFYAFLPVDSTGNWTVTYTAIACKSNVWVLDSCSTYKSGYTGVVEPDKQTVSLPQSGELKFTWK